MSVRTTLLATATLGAAIAGGVLAATPAQASTPTDACYAFTVAPYGPNRPLISYQQQIEIQARQAGIKIGWSATGAGLACAPSSYTVYSTLRKLPTQDMRYVSVHSTAPGTFEVSLPTLPDGMMTTPERSPWFSASTSALENGLQVVDDGSRTHLLVTGDPATVVDVFDTYYVHQVA